jgi:hypothetical protein
MLKDQDIVQLMRETLEIREMRTRLAQAIEELNKALDEALSKSSVVSSS